MEDCSLQKEAFGHHENGCHRHFFWTTSGSRGLGRPRRTTWHEPPETSALPPQTTQRHPNGTPRQIVYDRCLHAEHDTVEQFLGGLNTTGG